MQLTVDQFKQNLHNTIAQKNVVPDISNIKFIITPIKEVNVKYNSFDDYVRLGMLDKTNFKDRYFSIDEVADFLAFPNQKYPIWIKVLLKDESDGNLIFELQTSMRYRTPTQLKYIESGHPPFIFEKK